MPTLQELLSEITQKTDTQGQTKTAGKKALAQDESSATSEIDSVLESLGLTDSQTVKTAGDKNSTHTGGNMSLASIYEELVRADEETADQTKTASTEEGAEETQNEESGEDQSFGFPELVGHYMNVGMASYVEKVAADSKPLSHHKADSSLGATLGNVGDPAMPVNHDASSGEGMHTATGGESPYTLREAVVRAILKRKLQSAAGDVGAFNQQ